VLSSSRGFCFEGAVEELASMVESEGLRGGELNAAVTSALVGIQNAHLGRGPTSASTFHHGNVVVTLMRDVMTPAKRTLSRTGNAAAVTAMRHLFQEAMQEEFNGAVERLSGRKVLTFISGNHVGRRRCSSSTLRSKRVAPGRRRPGIARLPGALRARDCQQEPKTEPLLGIEK
jgi:uncharacterized protein YbcI